MARSFRESGDGQSVVVLIGLLEELGGKVGRPIRWLVVRPSCFGR